MNAKQEILIVGAGASGMIAAITAARNGAAVTVFEKLARPAEKVRASGGGRCNLGNTLPNHEFIARFGRHGKFMIPALKLLDSQGLRSFFAEIGVATHALDGFRIFPVGHNAETVASALEKEAARLGVKILKSARVTNLCLAKGEIAGIETESDHYLTRRVILACGGMGYAQLGGGDDGYRLARRAGHKIKEIFPAMLPLLCRETWVGRCRADTIGKAQIKINVPGFEKCKASGDLIFTQNGIRGPVVLDFSGEITPLLAKFGAVPVLLNLTGGLNQQQLSEKIRTRSQGQPQETVIETLGEIIPAPLAKELCTMVGANENLSYRKLPGSVREALLNILIATPLTIVGHGGFSQAMVTRGGVSLKEVCPETLASRLVRGLFFCGEMLDLNGPCGGFNLQWAFSSGCLAGMSAAAP